MSKKTKTNSSSHLTKHDTKLLLSSLTEGFIGSTIDLILYCFFLTGSLAGATTSTKIYAAFGETDTLITKINYKTFKKALQHLSERKLVARSRAEKKTFLTQKGINYLHSFIPVYRKIRTWNHQVYLISYDVPRTISVTRDKLRRFLRQIGCGMLQESLWVTPYNPTDALTQFISDAHIEGTVLVSRLGEGGTIGDENLKELVKRIYKLSALNKRYEEFIERFSKKRNMSSRMQITTAYLMILTDDPQLPFELLPKDFLGNAAYELYRKYAGDTVVSPSDPKIHPISYARAQQIGCG